MLFWDIMRSFKLLDLPLCYFELMCVVLCWFLICCVVFVSIYVILMPSCDVVYYLLLLYVVLLSIFWTNIRCFISFCDSLCLCVLSYVISSCFVLFYVISWYAVKKQNDVYTRELKELNNYRQSMSESVKEMTLIEK